MSAELVSWAAEVNSEVARLVAWMEDHPHAEARLARRPGHRGHLGTRVAGLPDGRTETSVRLRDSRRAGGGQYATIHKLADVEVKVGARYVPAEQVVTPHLTAGPWAG